MDFFKATSTGWTLILAIALAVGLSLAPVPEALRPFPSLQQGPVGPRLLALVVPKSGARAAPGEAPGGGTPEAPGDGLPTVPDEEETEVASAPEPDVPPPPPSVSDALGLEGLSAPVLTQALSLEATRERMGAQHVDLEPGCRRRGPSGCEEGGLEPFFNALSALRDGRRSQPVRVVHLGDSLIASDHITDVVRDRLQERFGSGGKGLLFIDRPTGAGRGVRAGTGAQGWQISRLIDRAYPRERLGFTGVAFASGASGSAGVRYAAEGARQAELFFLAQPGGGTVQLLADGQPLQRIQTRGFIKPEAAFAKVALPEGTQTLALQTSGKVEVHGVSLESGTPGIVYDTVGLPGATAEVYTRAQYGAFRAQLRHRRPALVVLMVGGNEAFLLARDRTKPEEIRAQTAKLVKWVRESVPDAACLLTAPIDAAVRTMGGELVPRRTSREVGALLREVAQEGGCAFWDALGAMGGEGAAIRWLSTGMMNADLVHPRAKGADLLGHLFDLALARAYHRARPLPGAVPEPRGLQNAPEALARTFARMHALETKQAERLGIVQLGASHTSSHYFTDAMRAALVQRFGDGGRGYIAAGKPSQRLLGAKVVRELTGDWQVLDALNNPEPGAPWGLTGIRAVGAPGASLRIQFCEGCAPAKTPPARLDLFWLDGPGAGKMEVKVDGVLADPEPPPPEPFTAPTLRIRSFPVEGPAHDVQVLNLGEGPLTVLGAALDLGQPGVVYDSVGLPGSTVFALRDHQPETLHAQLTARKPQLLVLWYGTNESGVAELDAATLRRDYVALLGRLRAATGAECLLIGSTDRLGRGEDGAWREAPSLHKVLATLPEVAREAGCAYWSSRAAMGGERAMVRWQTAGLGHEDGVHLTQPGYEKLAGFLLTDVLKAYEAWKKAGGPVEGVAQKGAP